MSGTGAVVVVGAGMHARRILHALAGAGRDVRCVADEAIAGASLHGMEVLRLADAFARIDGAEYVVAIGNASMRERLDAACAARGWTPVSVTHPRAYVSPDARVEPGAVILAGAVVEVAATLERGAIVDIGALVDHEATIGRYAHVAPGAVVNARCAVPAYSRFG